MDNQEPKTFTRKYIKCPKCKEDILPNSLECPECGVIIVKYLEKQQQIPEEEKQILQAIKYLEERAKQLKIKSNIQEPSINTTKIDSNKKKESTVAIFFIRFFAGINFICGIIGAIVIYVNIGTEAIPDPILGTFFIFAFLIEAVFVWAFISVICQIAENIIEIRKKTSKI